MNRALELAELAKGLTRNIVLKELPTPLPISLRPFSPSLLSEKHVSSP